MGEECQAGVRRLELKSLFVLERIGRSKKVIDSVLLSAIWSRSYLVFNRFKILSNFMLERGRQTVASVTFLFSGYFSFGKVRF